MLKRSILRTIIMAGFINCLAVSQTVTAAWEYYLSVDDELTTMTENARIMNDRRRAILNEIQNSQSSQTWYNGWYIEMKLARLGDRQVELTDSRQSIQKRIDSLTVERDRAFALFKDVYQKRLLGPQASQQLSLAEKEQAIIYGQKLIAGGSGHTDFPDYTSLMNGEYGDSAIRKLIISDLRSILEMKLETIDSLIQEKKIETSLLDRLNEFHRDLSYQYKSDIDFSRNTDKNQPQAIITDEDYGFVTSDPEKTTENNLDRFTTETNASYYPVEVGEFGLSANPVALDREIIALQQRYRQYQKLLQQIKIELAH